jgi:outer membrane immunogenic protein
MKRSLAAAVGFLGLVLAMPASAADLPRGSTYKAPAYVAQYNWTGFYLGINGGGGLGDLHWNGLPSQQPVGGMIGGTAGYNWQGRGSPWVFGLEGDID